MNGVYHFSHTQVVWQGAVDDVRAPLPPHRRGDDGDGRRAVRGAGGHEAAGGGLHLRQEAAQQGQLPLARARAVRRRLPEQLGVRARSHFKQTNKQTNHREVKPTRLAANTLEVGNIEYPARCVTRRNRKANENTQETTNESYPVHLPISRLGICL